MADELLALKLMQVAHETWVRPQMRGELVDGVLHTTRVAHLKGVLPLGPRQVLTAPAAVLPTYVKVVGT